MKRNFKCLIWIAVAIGFVVYSADPQTAGSELSDLEKADAGAAAEARTWSRESQAAAERRFLENAERWINLGKRNRAAEDYRQAGRVRSIIGTKAEAEDLFRRGLALISTDREAHEFSMLSAELALTALDSGRIDESKGHVRRALDNAVAGDEKAIGFAHFASGELHYFAGDLDSALTDYQRAAEAWKNFPEDSDGARNQLSLGYLLVKQNAYQAAFETFNKTFEMYSGLDDRRGQAITYVAIGATHMMTNDKQSAIEYYNKAEKMFPDDIDQTERAILFNNQGAVYEDYGEWELSRRYRERALALFSEIGHTYGQLYALHFLARMSSLTPDSTDAADYLEKGKKLAIELRDRQFIGLFEENNGNYRRVSGDLEGAADSYRRSMSIFRQIGSKRDLSRVLISVGKIRIATKKFADAKSDLTEARKLNAEVNDDFAESEALFNLGRLAALTGDHDAAMSAISKSVAITERTSANVTNSKLRSTYFSNVYDRYELLIELLMNARGSDRSPDSTIKGLQAAERSRARIILENIQLAEVGAFGDADPALVQREKEVRTKLGVVSEKVSELLAKGAARDQIDRAEAERVTLEDQLESTLGEIKQTSPIYSEIKNPSEFDIGGLQSEVLDDSTIFLEYAFGRERSYLWLVAKDRFEAFELPPRASIELRILRLRELLTARELLPGEDGTAYSQRLGAAANEYASESAALSRDLLGPVADAIAGKRLVVVPDGKLQSFPIAALPFPDSASGDPILTTNEVVYEPSGSTLISLRRRYRENVSDGRLLILADPVFAAADPRAQLKPAATYRSAERIDQLQRLGASGEEASMIDSLFARSDIVSGLDANRSALLGMNLRTYSILHFATHGIVDEQRPELSGIVLSRVNDKSEEQDAVVRLHDIYGLRLNADLVTISACNSGIGKELRGEGLMSLNSAFLQAGSKTVVSSLWKVDDKATMLLMSEFYGAMRNEKLPPSQALRRAQLALMSDPAYRSPFYWAAFVTHGDFENLPAVSPKTSRKPIIVILLVIALVAAGFGVRRLISR